MNTAAADQITGMTGPAERPCARNPATPNPAAKIAADIRCSDTEPSVALGPMPGSGPPGSTSMSGLARIAHSANTMKTRRGGGADRADRGIGAPGHDQAAGHQQAEHDHRDVGMKTVQHDQGRAEQIGRERAGRDRLDLAFLRGRTEHEAAHHEQCGEDEAGDHMERMRGDHRRAALQAGERPQQREHDRGDRKPAPHPHARQTEGGRGDDGEIDVERPEVRLVGRDQDRGDEGADDAETGQRRPVQQCRGQRAHRHQPEQDERGGGHQEAVQRIGSVDGGKGHRRAGGGQDRRDVGDRQRFDRGNALLAAGPFAGGEQRQREQAAQRGTHVGAEQAGLDRIAHHEEAAERQRQAADPHHPAGADGFLEPAIGLRQRRRRCRGGATSGLLARICSGAMDSTSGTIGGGSAAIPGEAGGSVCSNACNGESGGGTDVAVAAVVPIVSSRVRSSAIWFIAFRRR